MNVVHQKNILYLCENVVLLQGDEEGEIQYNPQLMKLQVL